MNDFQASCKKLNHFLKQTEKVKFESGEEYGFILKKRHTEIEIDNFEKKHQICLPEEYKYFLINVGTSKLYIDEYGLGVELYNLEDLKVFSESVFVNMKSLFPSLLIIGSILGRGDLIGFDLEGNRGSSNFSVFSHEDNPEYWLETNSDWSKFSLWLRKLVESEGEDDLI
ncbi:MULTISPECIES: SMI1/KNR4 family protein [unclassified Pseudoalteromonas]|uniref:SMI1/KNR4 family protein n=1 Tax=unclassified Pseudoalteromonas TaxID=194690 RepID=UPI00110AFAA4|nr:MULTISPECIES: SMI1/KNR4 family protein [unclassified Pseudoalteromonas]MDN3474895.1 SMI1/KNR4 family protein [Pseudoalteromonas sp. APC 3355]TMN95152.1 hypothetical protein CWB66_18645 [Pseudoalteromonas sp. S558]